MMDKQLLRGNSFQTGEFGHMLLIPGGKMCYCGKAGCADAYLSPRVLTSGDESLDGFLAVCMREINRRKASGIPIWSTLRYCAPICAWRSIWISSSVGRWGGGLRHSYRRCAGRQRNMTDLRGMWSTCFRVRERIMHLPRGRQCLRLNSLAAAC